MLFAQPITLHPAAAKWFRHSSGRRDRRCVRWRSSTVCSAALRSRALSLAKAYSIGLKSRTAMKAGACPLDPLAHFPVARA